MANGDYGYLSKPQLAALAAAMGNHNKPAASDRIALEGRGV